MYLSFLFFLIPLSYLWIKRKSFKKSSLILMSLLILFLYLKPILEFIFQISPNEHGRYILTRGEGIIAGGVFVLLFVYLYANKLIKKGTFCKLFLYEKVIVILFFFNFLTLVVGLIMKNDIGYIISDSYKFILIPAVYFSTLKISSQEKSLKIFNIFLKIIAIVVLLTLAYQVYTLLSSTTPKGAPNIITYFIPFLLLSLAYRKKHTKKQKIIFSSKKNIILLILTLLVIVLSFTRRIWITSIFSLISSIFIIGVVLFPRILRILFKISLVGLIVLIFCLGIFKAVLPQDYLTQIGTKIKSLTERTIEDFSKTEQIILEREKAEGSFSTKIAEGMDSLEHMKESGTILNYIIGMGNGAEYEIKQSRSSSRHISSKGESFDHQIHTLPFALFFRRGILGLTFVALLFLFLVLTYCKKYFIIKNDGKIIFGSALIIVLTTFLGTLSTSRLFFSVPFWMFLGIIGALLRNKNLYFKN